MNEPCKCGHEKGEHDAGEDECYHNEQCSGATGCLCPKFRPEENKMADYRSMHQQIQVLVELLFDVESVNKKITLLIGNERFDLGIDDAEQLMLSLQGALKAIQAPQPGYTGIRGETGPCAPGTR